MPDQAQPGRPWLLRFAIGFGLFALAMAVVSWTVLASWSALEEATAAEAAAAMDAAREAAAAGEEGVPPYIEITPAGEVVVHRELEREGPQALSMLHLLAWQPSEQRLARVDFPFWFVRLKLSRAVGLGTLVAAVVGDWKQLDLGVTEDDLEQRGPALVLDHARADGARVLLWTE